MMLIYDKTKIFLETALVMFVYFLVMTMFFIPFVIGI